MSTLPRPLSLLILALLGGCPGTGQSGEPVGPPPLSAAARLEETSAWKSCLATWQEAAEVASGARGDYPFTEKGQKELVERLEKSRAALRSFQGEGLLTQPEADLLDLDVATLLAAVWAKRPKELELATCYQPRLYQPRQESLSGLEQRVAALEALAAQEVLRPAVVERVLVQIEQDLTVLSGTDGVGLNPEEQVRADEVAGRVRAALEALKR